MSVLLPPSPTLSGAWAAALAAAVAAPTGQRSHVLMTVTEPCTELAGMREAVDAVITTAGEQSVETVAGTIFPADLYPVPPLAWDKDLQGHDRAVLDQAARSLYDRYTGMLPLLLTADGSRYGTYFQRLVSYPGPGAGGFNQLASRITSIRAERTQARRQGNYFNLDLAQDGTDHADAHHIEDTSDIEGPQERLEGPTGVWAGSGLQLLRPEQKHTRGFPCLVHIDLTMEQDRLHLFAVYRRQNLVTKAYGNLLGLSRLQAFLCQQTGLGLGELTVMATFADAEYGVLSKRQVYELSRHATSLTN